MASRTEALALVAEGGGATMFAYLNQPQFVCHTCEQHGAIRRAGSQPKSMV